MVTSEQNRDGRSLSIDAEIIMGSVLNRASQITNAYKEKSLLVKKLSSEKISLFNLLLAKGLLEAELIKRFDSTEQTNQDPAIQTYYQEALTCINSEIEQKRLSTDAWDLKNLTRWVQNAVQEEIGVKKEKIVRDVESFYNPPLSERLFSKLRRFSK